MEAWPKITVVVPIRNEARFIGKTLDYLVNQDYPSDKLEILVGVGDSVDNTADIVKEYESRDRRVRYFHNPGGLSSSARSLGAQNATGEIVIYVDGHTYIDNYQVLKSTALLMEDKKVAVLSRPQFLDTPDNTLFQKAVSLARQAPIGHAPDSTIYDRGDAYVDPSSSGAAYRREVFSKVGYFDESFDACEDVEFNCRVSQAGYKSYTSMRIAIYYYPRASLGGLFQQLRRYGIGRFRLARKHRGTISAGTLIPPLFVVGLPLLAASSFFWRPVEILFAAAIGLYLLVILGWSAAIAASRGLAYLLILPSVFLTIHVAVGWGFCEEMICSLFGRRRRDTVTTGNG
jgi:glycosyltransferase involved in cell wall biosynthesis